ncbi:MAG: PTS transporter subunit EIIB, partial [Exiguobacterium sp.]|nr:PTS transporter subunit EIIB [Exiguobacterium sp.]
MKADYRQIAAEILDAIGGKDNVDKAAHCVTRLRLSLKDQSKVDEARVKEVDL